MTPRPRIVVLAHPRHPVAQPFAGGMESHTWHLCRELTTLGAHTTLYAPAGSDPGIASELRVYPRLTLSATAARDVTRPSDQDLQEHHAMMFAIAEITRDPRVDVVHNQTLHHLPIATAGLLPPVVTTVHTPPFSWLESAIRVGGDDNTFVAVSRHLRQEFEPVTHVPPRVIPNGVDTSVFAPGPGGTDLAWTGRMVPEKAPHLAIDAAVSAGRRLVLMGPISDEGYFRDQIEPRLSADVVHLGHLDRHGVAAVLQRSAACLVTPVWPEPFGLTAAEAVCCGTPVVGFSVGGLREVIAAPELGTLVPAGDTAALAGAIEGAVHLDRGLVAHRAHRRFSLRAMGIAYLELFAELTQSSEHDRAG